ncbi:MULTISPECIES: hypothetical protein [Prochlorococcus]|uniref:hypothetical protein n=1 Tax=Prochlorococcus TaxID=1218 RepID=UPI000533B91A|nr:MULTISPECIES: hypothetical protein [Prochlorococcus]KGG13143.1 hypothetical protein EV05_0821 [Prochlorococcus sp. MIT 0601]
MIKSKKLIYLIIIASLLVNSGCKKSTKIIQKKNSLSDIVKLEDRVSKLESIIKVENNYKGLKKEFGKKVLYIKSITLRLGSEDDRLRIYWHDGMKTDLPCTKEQSTWACG